jgi:hypothetical protein
MTILKNVAEGNLRDIDQIVLDLRKLPNSLEGVAITIEFETVKNIFDKLVSGDISIEQVIKWINLIWFKDLFIYEEEHRESISEMLYWLEQLDEESISLEYVSEKVSRIIKDSSNLDSTK